MEELFKNLSNIIILIAIMQIALIVAFIILVTDIAKIRKFLLTGKGRSYEYYLRKAYMSEFLGDKQKYRDYLMVAKYRLTSNTLWNSKKVLFLQKLKTEILIYCL
ncbi:MAG: hypothetical protein LBI60_01945 [Bacteroidales bacterium]|jgi:hypothetical protein|nr:hypothetical protein [Bacteroidales bacterium]